MYGPGKQTKKGPTLSSKCISVSRLAKTKLRRPCPVFGVKFANGHISDAEIVRCEDKCGRNNQLDWGTGSPNVLGHGTNVRGPTVGSTRLQKC